MNKFKCFELLGDVFELARIAAALDQDRSRGEGARNITEDEYQQIHRHVESLLEICKETGLKSAGRKAGMTAAHMKLKSATLGDVSSMATELRNILEALLLNTHDVQFLFVHQGRAVYVDNPTALFDESVQTAFPDAVEDMREAGNCLAADCDTAAVFHLMRVVEWGLRAFCVHLGFTHLKRKSRKPGKVQYVPAAFSEWEHILNELSDRVEKKLSRIRRGETKQAHQRYYHPLLEEVLSLRDGWRNHTMHARQSYNGKEAEVVLQHVQQFMSKLSERVKQV